MTGGVAAALEGELPHAYFLSSGGEGLTSDQSAGFGVRVPCTHRLTRPQDKGKVMSSRGLPVLAGENGLSRYLSEIRKFPLLSAEDEYMFAKRWQAHEDPEAARRLVTSHLRLVAKIAMGYRGYGLPLSEVVSEGNVGLMQAVKRFDPDKGFRLATYAMWWIRAAIQEYVLRSWSMVKLGTTAAQKKLFFNLRKAKSHIGAIEEGDLTPQHVTQLADRLGVTEKEVTDMNRRLSGPDSSLNAPLRSESESEWQDWLADDTIDQETSLAQREEMGDRHLLLENAMTELTEREQEIIRARRLREEPATLEELSQKFGVSRERVRQIEVRAFEKLQKAMQAALNNAPKALENRPN
jgi:RNA polymerase sigma-32 factor